MLNDGFCDLALTQESLELHHHLHRAVPEYQASNLTEMRHKLLAATFQKK